MLCKIALGWFFLWRKSGTVVAVGVPDVFFALWVDWLIDFFLTSTLGHPNSNNFASNLCSSVKSMMWDTSPFVVLALI